MPLLRYGTDSTVNLELANEALVAVCDAPRGRPLTSVSAATAAALAEPLGFPPLAQAALPGDRVVLALQHGVPRAAAIVASTVESLLAAGVRAGDITLLRTSADTDSAAANPLAELPEAVRAEITSRVHDPEERERLSYLAATADAQPIYISRTIHDADLVISIGVLRPIDAPGYHGINSGLFPAFSDIASLARFRSPEADQAPVQARLRKQADEVGWLLGARFTIQVVPGAGNHLLHVLAGDVDAVMQEGGRLYADAWSYSVPERASLVVAAIEGDAAQQTWENVGRALMAATRVLEDDGSVVICSELVEPLGPGLQRIAGAEDLHGAIHEIARDHPADALPAAKLAQALQRGKIYLLSRIEDELIEDLGMLPLDARGVGRVAGRYTTCIVLANAPYAEVRCREEESPAPTTLKSRSRS